MYKPKPFTGKLNTDDHLQYLTDFYHEKYIKFYSYNDYVWIRISARIERVGILIDVFPTIHLYNIYEYPPQHIGDSHINSDIQPDHSLLVETEKYPTKKELIKINLQYNVPLGDISFYD